MWKARIFVSAFFLLLALGSLQFAQDAPMSAKNPNAERQGVMLGLVRTINTIEVTEVTDYGSYAPWPILLAHHQEDFSGWLKRFYSSGEPNARYGDMPEILPGWNLRLNAQADGKGYVLLLADTSDKTGFAWVSDYGDMPEILPGWNLRLNAQADGKGYVLLLADTSDKTGFAWVSDESGIIRHSKSIQ